MVNVTSGNNVNSNVIHNPESPDPLPTSMDPLPKTSDSLPESPAPEEIRHGDSLVTQSIHSISSCCL